MVALYHSIIFGAYLAILYLVVRIAIRYHARMCESLKTKGWDWANLVRLAVIMTFGFGIGGNVALWGTVALADLIAVSPLTQGPVADFAAEARVRFHDAALVLRVPLRLCIVLAGLIFVSATFDFRREARRDSYVVGALLLFGWAVGYVLSP